MRDDLSTHSWLRNSGNVLVGAQVLVRIETIEVEMDVPDSYKADLRWLAWSILSATLIVTYVFFYLKKLPEG